MTDDKEKTAEAVAPVAEQTSAPEGVEAPVELTVADLNNLKQIIDVASGRGAFKPNEMTVVGTVYTKLEAFLTAVAAQQKAQEGAKNA
jgi:hypothetical protein|tara:strand:- start:430 stop:693 length:264 start_codon:yes stop_codon:yes gene_type:complete